MALYLKKKKKKAFILSSKIISCLLNHSASQLRVKVGCQQRRSQGRGGGGATTPLAHPKKNPLSLLLILIKNPNLIFYPKNISLSLLLIKNPNLIFSFDRNSNLDQIIHQLELSSLSCEEFHLINSSTHSHLMIIQSNKTLLCFFSLETEHNST